MTRPLATIISSFCLIALTGCAVFPWGGAKTGFGYSSESKVFLFHEAEDNDNKPEYRIEVDPTVLERLLEALLPETPKTESADEAGTGSEPPPTSD